MHFSFPDPDEFSCILLFLGRDVDCRFPSAFFHMPSETEVDVKLALQQQITTAVQSSLLSKILITCETSATVIFKYFDQSELLDIGIHRVDKLKSQRSAEEEMMGIYVCVSTPETLATIMADFKSTPAYKEAYFISIGVIPYSIN